MVYGRDHMDLVDQIAALGESGFRGVGFHTAPSLAPFRAFDPFRASPNAIDRLRRVLAGFKKIEVHGPFSDWDVSLVSPNSTVRSASLGELKQHIDFAAHIGASVFTAHPGKTSAPVPPEEQLDRLRESLQQLAEIAEARGFLVCVETADILANTSNLRCFEGIQCPYLGITMDTGHISFHPPGTKPGYAPHSSIEEFVQAWGRHIKHVHVNDYNSERDHIGIGQGELPLKGVLGALHRVGYQGFFDMEVDPVVVPAKDMPVERDLLERLIAETWNDASQGRS
jgi:sugar phosphate isomerase/epimerase